ncbi:glycosyltransferase family 4 protein [Cellulomonas fengjieae]|uniref:Glycosyltransferase family 4 protein n=1 Tax=Cellulomonas fengjieae TaxID=2819978 RepID=A0ABS3SFV6_9CELL|nr:glycosyltransferase family 1 protein [Cellulomonas fengjieae]MBO3083840.1 glycosyltransferase family 4 protein [Cellulomonas fengjieae]QVI64874.1 glycosyltransferase family 4 protein [Cellulomonas fengjieae]
MTRTVNPRYAVGRTLARAGAIRARVGEPRVSPSQWHRRLLTLARALEPDVPGSLDATQAEHHVLRLLGPADDARTWLALAVLSARLPTADEVTDARRAAQLAGPRALLEAARAAGTAESVRREVRVVTDDTIVDIGDLVLFPLGTGIQRVARSVTRAWREQQSFTAVGWTPDMDAIYALDDAACDAALSGATRVVAYPHDDDTDGDDAPVTVVVPWRGTYVLPELAIQARRCASLQSMARFSRTRCGVIGFDCVPLTSAETSATGFPAVFALNLAAVAEFDVVATISRAAAAEYEGWRRMLAGAGLPGPRVTPLLLPAHAPKPSPKALQDARERFVVAQMPFVLCVGSHEPRKNHLAVLHAAEVLWRRGMQFSLSFVGGNSWNSDEFTERLGELIGAGRPVESVSSLSDRMLWGAYRLARCTVFPSVNEGFGLPVAESLAAGTPAITSDFGSMREIAAHGGALLIDPRREDQLVDALERMLTDDELHATLSAQAVSRPEGTWEQYAARLWEIFHTTAVDG